MTASKTWWTALDGTLLAGRARSQSSTDRLLSSGVATIFVSLVINESYCNIFCRCHTSPAEDKYRRPLLAKNFAESTKQQVERPSPHEIGSNRLAPIERPIGSAMYVSDCSTP